MANDKASAGTKLVEFRKSHPVDFSLLDKDEQAVMYISEDADDWSLHLTVANTSSQPITLTDGPDQQASSANHHFALRFRPGTLSQRTLARLTGQEFAEVVKTPGWRLAQLSARPAPNAPATLYLLYTGADRELAKNEDENDALRIELSGVSAAPGSGARGTQVELIPNPAQVRFASDGGGITGSRTQYLHVTNHSGRKNIPLHVGFVTGNRVLNGESATIILRITNVLKPKDASKSADITFRGSGARLTKLVLSYDAGSDDWALARPGAAQSAKVSVGDWALARLGAAHHMAAAAASGNLSTTVIQAGEQSQAPEWVITFDGDFPLAPGRHLDITLDKLLVSEAAGPSNLYLRYENIPGYWDGQFVCAVEKEPIVVRGGNVGIGMTPKAPATTPTPPKLEVAGATKTTTLNVTDASTLSTLTVTGKAAAPRDGAGAGTIQIGEGKLELGWQDGQGQNPGQGWIQTQESKHLALNPIGGNRVGIGTTEPSAKLEVAGATKTKTLEVAGETKMDFGPDGKLLFQGNTKRNPGIFALDADQLTISGEGEEALPKLVLRADEVFITGGITVGEDIWKDVGQYGSTQGKQWQSFTRPASRKDSAGALHLQGSVFGGHRGKDTYVVRLHQAHWGRYSDTSFQARGITRDWVTVWCPLWLVGSEYAGSEAGWIKVAQELDENLLMIFLDGISFPQRA